MPDETINYRFTGSADFSDAETSIDALEQRMQQAFEGLSRIPSGDFPSAGGSPWRNELGQFAAPTMGVEATSMAAAEMDIGGGGLGGSYASLRAEGMGGRGVSGSLQLGELDPGQTSYIRNYLEGAAEGGAGFEEMSFQLSRYLGWETGAWGKRVTAGQARIPDLSAMQFEQLAQYVGAEGAGGVAGGGAGGGGPTDILGALQMMAGGGAGGMVGGGLQLAGMGAMEVAGGVGGAIAIQQTMALWNREVQESAKGLSQFTEALTGAIPMMETAGRVAGAGMGMLGGAAGLGAGIAGAGIGAILGGSAGGLAAGVGAIPGAGLGAVAGYIASQTILKPFADAAQEIMGIISEATAAGLQSGISLAFQLGGIRRQMGGSFGGLAGAGAAGEVFGFDLLSSLQGQGAGIYGPMMEARLGMWGVGTGGGMMGAMEQMRGVYGGMDPLMRLAMTQSLFGAQGGAAGRMLDAPEDIWQRAMGIGREREAWRERGGEELATRVGQTRGLLGAQVGNMLLEIGEHTGPIAIRVMERLMSYIESRGPMIVDVFEKLALMMERGVQSVTVLLDRTMRLFNFMVSNPVIGAVMMGSLAAGLGPVVQGIATMGAYGALRAAGTGPTAETAGYGAGPVPVEIVGGELSIRVTGPTDFLDQLGLQLAEARFREVTRG